MVLICVYHMALYISHYKLILLCYFIIIFTYHIYYYLIYRFSGHLRSIDLPCEYITVPIMHEIAIKCPSVRRMTLDFSKATQVSVK